MSQSPKLLVPRKANIISLVSGFCRAMQENSFSTVMVLMPLRSLTVRVYVSGDCERRTKERRGLEESRRAESSGFLFRSSFGIALRSISSLMVTPIRDLLKSMYASALRFR